MPDAAVREPLAGPSDRDSLRRLFRDLARGRSEALEPIYRELSADVYGLALWRIGSTEDAADVLQEVFVRLARTAPRLDRVRDPRAFVLRMAHRSAMDVHRKRMRRRERPLEDATLVEATVPGERAADAVQASRLLRELPAGQREVVFLHVFAGCSFAETARAMGIPTFTAASRYRLALERLRRLLGVKR